MKGALLKSILCTLFNFSLTTKLIICAELLWSFPKFVVVKANKNNSIFDLQSELELEHSLPISLKILNLSYSLKQIINSKQIFITGILKLTVSSKLLLIWLTTH